MKSKRLASVTADVIKFFGKSVQIRTHAVAITSQKNYKNTAKTYLLTFTSLIKNSYFISHAHMKRLRITYSMTERINFTFDDRKRLHYTISIIEKR